MRVGSGRRRTVGARPAYLLRRLRELTMPVPEDVLDHTSSSHAARRTAALVVSVSTEAMSWLLLDEHTSAPLTLRPVGAATKPTGGTVSRVPLSRPTLELIRPGLRTLSDLARSRAQASGHVLNRLVLVVDPGAPSTVNNVTPASSPSAPLATPIPPWADGPGWVDDLAVGVSVNVIDAGYAAAEFASARSATTGLASLQTGHLHLDLAGLACATGAARPLRSFFVSGASLASPAGRVVQRDVVDHIPTTAAHRCACGGRGHLATHPAWESMREALRDPGASGRSRVEECTVELGQALGEVLAGCASWWGPVSVSLGSNAPLPSDVLETLRLAALVTLSELASTALAQATAVSVDNDTMGLLHAAHRLAGAV